MTAPVASLRGVSHRYGATLALDGVDLEIPAGTMAGMIGPDGVGKSTLMGLVAGVIRLQRGALRTLGGDMAEKAHRDRVCPRIAYLPQGLGRNLYMDLSIQENLDFFGRLFGQGARERARRIGTLAQATGLGPFLDRPAGQLSGGMTQKLGLCCALLHDPDLLLLDEPTTGVDPLSRRQFWDIIGAIRAERPDLSLLVSTAYMEEAERFQWLVAMNAGRILAQGSPGQLKAAHGAATLEDAFVALLPADQRGRPGGGAMPPRPSGTRAPVLVAEHLCRGGHPHRVRVLDAVATGQSRVDQGHRLEADVGVTWRSTKVHVAVEELAQPEMIGQRRRLDQPRVGDDVVVVESHQKPVWAVRR